MSLVGYKSTNHPQQVAKRGASERDNLGTDPKLFAELDERFHFTLDAAATAANAKCGRFFTVDDDGLEQPWSGRVWCNPPYSQIGAWVEKAWNEIARRAEMVDPVTGYRGLRHTCDLIVMLLPANRPEQGWWQDLVEPYRDHGYGLRTEFLRGRQRFVMPGAEAIGPNERPPFGCVLLIWDRGQTSRSSVGRLGLSGNLKVIPRGDRIRAADEPGSGEQSDEAGGRSAPVDNRP